MKTFRDTTRQAGCWYCGYTTIQVCTGCEQFVCPNCEEQHDKDPDHDSIPRSHPGG